MAGSATATWSSWRPWGAVSPGDPPWCACKPNGLAAAAQVIATRRQADTADRAVRGTAFSTGFTQIRKIGQDAVRRSQPAGFDGSIRSLARWGGVAVFHRLV